MNGPKKIEVAKPDAEPTEFDEVIDSALTLWSAGPVVRDALVTPQRRSAANRAWAAELNERAFKYGIPDSRASEGKSPGLVGT